MISYPRSASPCNPSHLLYFLSLYGSETLLHKVLQVRHCRPRTVSRLCLYIFQDGPDACFARYALDMFARYDHVSHVIYEVTGNGKIAPCLP